MGVVIGVLPVLIGISYSAAYVTVGSDPGPHHIYSLRGQSLAGFTITMERHAGLQPSVVKVNKARSQVLVVYRHVVVQGLLYLRSTGRTYHCDLQ